MTQFRLDSWDDAQTDIQDYADDCPDCTPDMPCFRHFEGDA